MLNLFMKEVLIMKKRNLLLDLVLNIMHRILLLMPTMIWAISVLVEVG
jgi:uncharacterized membrane protein YqaE (UPF0057 family)